MGDGGEDQGAEVAFHGAEEGGEEFITSGLFFGKSRVARAGSSFSARNEVRAVRHRIEPLGMECGSERASSPDEYEGGYVRSCLHLARYRTRANSTAP